jgi:glycosyltransferase involved in cell wall biosynthesis
MLPILYIVIPCYNEEKVLPLTTPLFLDKLDHLISLKKISSQSRLLFVNDGSRDKTWELIKTYADENPKILGISQSRNRGHQSTLFAGLMEAKKYCDITVSIDCDGQDDIDVIEAMVDAYTDGCDVVYGVRNNRETDTFFKRSTAELFYKFMNFMGTEVIFNHADYRLLSKRVLDELDRYQEVNLFLRGMIPLVGFKSTNVYYSRKTRIAGETHYPLSKMLGLAFDGITSLSIKPIRIITMIGIFIFILSILLIIWILIQYFRNQTVDGWPSMTAIVCFMGGIQMMSLGIVGEYIGKIYLETKRRPRYIISEKTFSSNDTTEP